MIGADTEIQYQAQRLDDPDYEINSHLHREIGRFGRFVTRVATGEANDVYLTAQNKDHYLTDIALRPLLSVCRPLPEWLRDDPCSGFIWLGRDTVTPLHYDLTDNTMCQVIGEKHVRLFGPDQTDRLAPSVGVHSSLGWVDDTVVVERDLQPLDIYLIPGRGVFVPPRDGGTACVPPGSR